MQVKVLDKGGVRADGASPYLASRTGGQKHDAFVVDRLVPPEQPRQVGRFRFFLCPRRGDLNHGGAQAFPGRQVGYYATDRGLTHPTLAGNDKQPRLGKERQRAQSSSSSKAVT